MRRFHGRRNNKFDKGVLKKHVEEHPDSSLHERAALFNVGVSRRMHDALKRLGIRKKRVMPYEKQAFLGKLAAGDRTFGFRNLVYIDESGFKAHCHRDAGWVDKGQQLLRLSSASANAAPTWAWPSAITPGGRKKEWLAPMLLEGSCTSQLLETWVEQCLIKALHDPTLIIMGNASFHHHKRIQDIVAKDYHDMIPLLPSSADLNPIEKTKIIHGTGGGN
ncbi:transposase [Nitrosococcus oceani]|uniref:transposase n=1 Tax=Nitrosococcus oceani TaxID=1229 RepID=UPI0035A25CB5